MPTDAHDHPDLDSKNDFFLTRPIFFYMHPRFSRWGEGSAIYPNDSVACQRAVVAQGGPMWFMWVWGEDINLVSSLLCIKWCFKRALHHAGWGRGGGGGPIQQCFQSYVGTYRVTGTPRMFVGTIKTNDGHPLDFKWALLHKN